MSIHFILSSMIMGNVFMLAQLFVNNYWIDFKAASCMPSSCFCEFIRTNQLIRQPSNSWSNLFFVIGSFIILYKIRGAGQNLMELSRDLNFNLTIFSVG